MSKQHYKEQLSAFADQEMNKEDRQVIAEHLMNCDECRGEYHTVKLGAGLASRLEQTDAPESVWRGIEAELDGQAPRLEAFSQPSWFSLRQVGALATSVAVVGLLSFLVYNGLTTGDRPVAVADQPELHSEPHAGVVVDSNSGTVDQPQVAAENTMIQPMTPGVETSSVSETPEFFAVQTVSGSPKIGDAAGGSQLAVGEYLETDARSRARIEVAEIGNVMIAPNSRVKLVGTSEKQHRLSLERGELHAKIAAPPRLFIVDTPSAVAVDLGCEYTLEVDKAGNSKLNVMSGFVALEQGGRESIVPAGAACMTMKGKGLGTPFSSVATPEFERALRSFDFAGGGSRAAKQIVGLAGHYDIVTLWHLLPRVSKNDRLMVFDALAKFVAPPAGVTREGILSLDKTMLEQWRSSVETTWFEN